MQIEETPKVSVIMPVYNGEQTLKYAIASLMRQTYENWICIIVNDGSTDNTYQIALKYANQYPAKIVLIQNKISLNEL